jgi:hypothetical protein
MAWRATINFEVIFSLSPISLFPNILTGKVGKFGRKNPWMDDIDPTHCFLDGLTFTEKRKGKKKKEKEARKKKKQERKRSKKRKGKRRKEKETMRKKTGKRKKKRIRIQKLSSFSL